MSIRKRLKNSPYIKNWIYPVTYFVTGTVFIVFFMRLVILDGWYHNIDAIGITISLFTILIYGFRIAGDLLAVNFVIKNHRQTPLLFAVMLGIVSFMLFFVRNFYWHNFEMAIIYPSIALFLIALIYHYYRFRHDEAESIMSYGIIFITLGLMLYCLVSFLLGNYGGISLVPLLFGTLVGGGIFAAGMVLRKKSHISSANLSIEDMRPLLEERVELFIAKLFKGLSLTGELIALREQITASLEEYMKSTIEEGIDANKLFADAVDSLGDFSELLYSHQKNILAHFIGSNNKAANLMFGAVLQVVLLAGYMLYLDCSDWISGSVEWDEYLFIFVFIIFSCIAILLILRTVDNFRQERHLTTPLSLGGAVALPLIIFFLAYNEHHSDGIGMQPLHIYIVSAVGALALVAQTVVLLMWLKKKKKMR